jgi:hypothetical protein
LNLECRDIPPGGLTRQIQPAAVGKERAAATLRVGSHHVITGEVQQSNTRGIRVTEHHAHGATPDKSDGPFGRLDDGGGEFRRLIRRWVGRNEADRFLQARREEPVKPKPLQKPGGSQSQAQTARDREDPFDHHAAQESLPGRPPVSGLYKIARLLEKRAILDSRRAGYFTRAAAQAKVDVSHACRIQRQAAILKRAHEVDTPAGGFVLITGLEIGRTSTEAKPAVDTGQRLAFIQKSGLRRHAFRSGNIR